MTTTKTKLDLATSIDALAPHAPSRLRTQLRAGGLLDEAIPGPRLPPRGWDGEPLPEWTI